METSLKFFTEKTLQIFVLIALLITGPYQATAQLSGAFNDAVKVIVKTGDDVATGTSRGTTRAANVSYVAPQRVKLTFTPSPTVTRRPSSTGRVIDNSSNASFDRTTPDPQATKRAIRQSTNARSNTTDVANSFERKRVSDQTTQTRISNNQNGRSGKQARLKELANDDKVSSSDRGWIKSETNHIRNGNRQNIRNPPGKDLAHERG